ncbi:hypothetical protein PENSPDRAFT_597464 [Peniophora sp. CONT]|nr:hypothetical protein PENSPDRAFT_597464 [Peniophora sp. CONT]
MSSDSKTPATAPAAEPPLIPESYIDIPTQRLYAISLGACIQAIKVFDFVRYLFSSFTGGAPQYGRKWAFVDLLFCVGLSYLRIPRLNYARAMVCLQIVGLWVLDGLLFGGIELHLLGGDGAHDAATDRVEYGSSSSFSSILSGPLALLGFESYADRDSHLQGQHTVRMSPISTAYLNPYGAAYCLESPSSTILVPLLLNNSNPTAVQYSITPLGYAEGKGMKIVHKTVGIRELKAIEAARTSTMQLVKHSSSADSEYDEYDDEDDAVPDDAPRLQKSQSLIHIQISQPGTVELQTVQDTSGVDARVVYPSSVAIAPCPRAQFTSDDILAHGESVKCAASDAAAKAVNVDLSLRIAGVPPLSLKWYKEVNGRQEYSMVEGIEDGHAPHRVGASGPAAPQTVVVPLAVQARALGTHIYALDSVTDALGNTVLLGESSTGHNQNDTFPASNTGSTARTLHVLRRPAAAFSGCSPARPSHVKIGGTTGLILSASQADAEDGPWDMVVQYVPPADDPRRAKGWTKTLQTAGNKRNLQIEADAPGTYTLVDVKGRYCEGDVLAPETCPVAEIPKPSAEIDWRGIHECSGDTGVEASLLLHGKAPFHIYYTMQRNKEPARELVKAYQNTRGELLLQPAQSGDYTYTFTHVSDANYQKVPLPGPSINQVVHPLAGANIVHANRPINSCAGESVEVEVEFKGIGPWSLDVQLVGLKESKTLNFAKIESARHKLRIPVPDRINKNGGSFDISLRSVEDSSGCRRTLTVPGVTVNVRRIKATAKFYGKPGERLVTTLDYEKASLPLRLTGEGPWQLKYRNMEKPEVFETAKLSSANDHLSVRGHGTYEIVEVYDSQCPGEIIMGESTYDVAWVPRPSAKLSEDTPGQLERWNGSFILPPICEGANSHVDLDLTGRAPFQILYNIARGENGGTRVLDQPMFNSIQPRTRFQLVTSDPGRILYEVKQVGDTAYPLAQHKDSVIPRAYRPLFEQQVLQRPEARFRTPDRLSYCLYDPFTPLEQYSTEGTVALEGTPPFSLTLSVKNIASGDVYTESVTVNSYSWRLDLPSYTFKSVGHHVITIESVSDAAGCEQTPTHPRERTISVDVAESAAIVPYDRREHFCAGETAQFQLEGIPPWTVGYKINSKQHTQSVSASPFALQLSNPGDFAVTSIAHQHARCRAAVTDLAYTVHDLPSARVGQGRRIFQDIHEGDQAEIKFTLVGEPPFTFTYQRSEPPAKKGGRPGRVLETHTVSGVALNEYSIFSALEGTWTVTFISDRYCRYPPSHPES